MVLCEQGVLQETTYVRELDNGFCACFPVCYYGRRKKLSKTNCCNWTSDGEYVTLCVYILPANKASIVNSPVASCPLGSLDSDTTH